MNAKETNFIDLKVAVITQTYYRKDGSTKSHLRNMFKMLKSQKYQNFKLFITGDNYVPKKEFLEVCSEYPGDIYVHNNVFSFRNFKLGSNRNYWACGGVLAALNSYSKAKEEDYDIAIMLDDDDNWLDCHISNIVTHFARYPETGLMVTKAEYCKKAYLPLINSNEIYYNNYIPGGNRGGSVRASTAHNIKIIGEEQIQIFNEIFNIVLKRHGKEDEEEIFPADAMFLELMGEKIKKGIYKSLYVPILSVVKSSDGNAENIM